MKYIYYIKLICLVLILEYPSFSNAQSKQDTLSDWERTFMPAIQMGYVAHGTDQLSGGLMIQTSLEYRDISNFVFRINYDDFKSNLEIPFPVNPDLTFTGNLSFSELIGGIGYRDKVGKHIFTGYIQGGIRTYGFPMFTTDSLQTNLEFDTRNMGIMRYSLGYEFALATKLFLTVEALISHTLTSKDYWADNRWSYGMTLGLSAPLF